MKAPMIPYNADIKLLQSILEDLKGTGSDGLLVDTMWTNIGAKSKIGKSYTMNLASYLELVDTDGKKARLTTLGRSINYAPTERRNAILISNLPKKYMAILKWIKTNGEMSSNDIKIQYINNFDYRGKPLLLDRAIATFLTYCESITAVRHTGKGKGRKAAITDFGRKTLDSPDTFLIGPPDSSIMKQIPIVKEGPATLKSKDGLHTIKIEAPGREPFFYDIKSQSDWDVIDSIIKSIKEDWERKAEPTKKPNRNKEADD